MNRKSEIILSSDQTASEAVREILRVLLEAFEAQLSGTLDGLDPEPLHDFRVATRRTRSAIGQLKRAVPPIAATRFAADFKWLGETTGPCRDLDVLILDLDTRRHTLPDKELATLSRIEDLVCDARNRAHAEIVDALSSNRFRRLLVDWKIFLSDPWPTFDAPPDAEFAIQTFADWRIRKAHKRVRRHSRDLGTEPEASALHELRIAAKKYRYLLEFFRSLYEPGQIDGRIKDLKGLQNVLGELNDRDFQHTHLQAISSEMKIASDTGALALVRHLQSDIDCRQRQLRLSVPTQLGPVVSRSPSQIPPST